MELHLIFFKEFSRYLSADCISYACSFQCMWFYLVNYSYFVCLFVFTFQLCFIGFVDSYFGEKYKYVTRIFVRKNYIQKLKHCASKIQSSHYFFKSLKEFYLKKKQFYLPLITMIL